MNPVNHYAAFSVILPGVADVQRINPPASVAWPLTNVTAILAVNAAVLD